MTRGFRIGVGAGFEGDRFDPAERLVAEGHLDSLVFECLAERTIALAHESRASGAGPGFDARILRRMRGTLAGATQQGISLLTNAGAANPEGAAAAVVEIADAMGLGGVRVAAVTGDDVLDQLDPAAELWGTDQTVADLGDRLVSANAYAGVSGLLAALDLRATVVVAGRVGDAALFAAPLLHHFGWSADDLDRMADATLVGHLLECGGQLSGGYFADGERKRVDGLATLGFPYADVDADGSAVYGKVPGTGGLISRETVLEQLLYEIDDPTSYHTPDVTLDMSRVRITEVETDRVQVSGARPTGRPEKLKVSLGVRDGYLAVGEIIYAGRGALTRARLAADIIRERWHVVHGWDSDDVRCDFVGYNSVRSWHEPDTEPPEVRARFTTRTFDPVVARTLTEETDALYTNGPYGGGGVTTSVRSTIGIMSTLIDRDAVTPRAVMVR